MKSFFIIVFVILIIGAGGYYYLQQHEEASNQASQPDKTMPLQLPQDATPQIQHPITEPLVTIDSDADNSTEDTAVVTEIEKPLPSLEESDERVKEILSEIFGDDLVNKIFKQTGLIYRFVVTIDNLPKKKLANKYRLLLPVSGKFLTEKESSDKITIDPNNFTRYNIYMQFLTMLDPEQFVQWYKRFYPLIQQTYDTLGYKNRYFNDRFIFVIDHLLKTPKVEGSIKLVQPKVFYEFADPVLEKLSAGQKILLRIGPENMAIVKEKLTKIREGLVTP
jgi:hypothetical protein